MSLINDFEPLSWDIAFWLQGATDPETPIEELGELCLELEEKLRGAAIILLLTEAKTDAFLHNLIRAASLWRGYLERCRAAGIDDDHDYCAGRFDPMLDAIAGRDFVLANTLAALAPSKYREGHEYESDFCYARTLHTLLTETPDKDALAALANRCAAAGDEMSAARAEACLALGARDQGAFEQGFSALVRARQDEIAKEEENGRQGTPTVYAARAIFVEGIAVLNLAERYGIALKRDYPMCPSLARVPMRQPYPGR